MKNSKFSLFTKAQISASPAKVTGGRTVFCKDGNGTNLGSYETTCDDSSYWLSDCKGIYPGTQQAAG